jgi:hypothetical protein
VTHVEFADNIYCERSFSIHHEARNAAQPQPNFGVSLAKAQRSQSSEIKNESFLSKALSYTYHLGAFAPWREEIPSLDCGSAALGRRDWLSKKRDDFRLAMAPCAGIEWPA